MSQTCTSLSQPPSTWESFNDYSLRTRKLGVEKCRKPVLKTKSQGDRKRVFGHPSLGIYMDLLILKQSQPQTFDPLSITSINQPTSDIVTSNQPNQHLATNSMEHSQGQATRWLWVEGSSYSHIPEQRITKDLHPRSHESVPERSDPPDAFRPAKRPGPQQSSWVVDGSMAKHNSVWHLPNEWLLSHSNGYCNTMNDARARSEDKSTCCGTPKPVQAIHGTHSDSVTP